MTLDAQLEPSKDYRLLVFIPFVVLVILVFAYLCIMDASQIFNEPDRLSRYPEPRPEPIRGGVVPEAGLGRYGRIQPATRAICFLETGPSQRGRCLTKELINYEWLPFEQRSRASLVREVVQKLRSRADT